MILMSRMHRDFMKFLLVHGKNLQMITTDIAHLRDITLSNNILTVVDVLQLL